MNDRLRVDHYIDAVIINAEQKMRFDDFQRLVGERCTIDRDLGTHVPRWMPQRILARDVFELSARMIAERTARSRKNQTSNFFIMSAAQALQNCAVLAVNRNELAAPTLERVEHERPARDE